MLKVLVVEDELYVRKGIVLTVDWAKYDCSVIGEATNGEEGLALALDKRPDIIVTDIKMPKMDGLEMLVALREKGLDCAVIILTAYSDFTYAQKALRYGATDYLLKPFHDGELERVIEGILARKSDTAKTVSTLPALQLKTGGKGKYVSEAIAYIAAHYGDPDLTIGTIADSLCISEGHLSHVFKRETGCTLIEYLSQYRIHMATRLLKDCRLKVNEVARSVGYRDFAYFSATFRKLMGTTPSDYSAGRDGE